MKENEKLQSSSLIAGEYYEPNDEKKKNEAESGMAITHEQATDTFTEGTIDGKIEISNGKTIDLPHQK